MPCKDEKAWFLISKFFFLLKSIQKIRMFF